MNELTIVIRRTDHPEDESHPLSLALSRVPCVGELVQLTGARCIDCNDDANVGGTGRVAGVLHFGAGLRGGASARIVVEPAGD